MTLFLVHHKAADPFVAKENTLGSRTPFSGTQRAAAPLDHPNQAWSLRIGDRNYIMRRGWFTIWSALAITLALFAAPLHAQFAYVVNGGDNNVSAYTINSDPGELTPIPGPPVTTGTLPADAAADPGPQFVE